MGIFRKLLAQLQNRSLMTTESHQPDRLDSTLCRPWVPILEMAGEALKAVFGSEKLVGGISNTK